MNDVDRVVSPLGQAKKTPGDVTLSGVVKPTTVPLPSTRTVLMVTLSDNHHWLSTTVNCDTAKPDERSTFAFPFAQPSAP